MGLSVSGPVAPSAVLAGEDSLQTALIAMYL
jgi:hypothetical protein